MPWPTIAEFLNRTTQTQPDQSASPGFNSPAGTNDVNLEAPSAVSAGPQDISPYSGPVPEVGGFADRPGHIEDEAREPDPQMQSNADGSISGPGRA